MQRKPEPFTQRERMLLHAGAEAYKNFINFRFAFYISVVCNIIMFFLMNRGLVL